MPLFNSIIRGELLTSELWTAKFGLKKLETSLYRVVHNIILCRYIDPVRRGHQCDGQTGGETDNDDDDDGDDTKTVRHAVVSKLKGADSLQVNWDGSWIKEVSTEKVGFKASLEV